MIHHFQQENHQFETGVDEAVELDHVLDQYVNAVFDNSADALTEDQRTLVKNLATLAFNAGRSFQEDENAVDDEGVVTLRLQPNKAAALIEWLLGG